MKKMDNENIEIKEKFKDFIMWNADNKQNKFMNFFKYLDVLDIVSLYIYI